MSKPTITRSSQSRWSRRYANTVEERTFSLLMERRPSLNASAVGHAKVLGL